MLTYYSHTADNVVVDQRILSFWLGHHQRHPQDVPIPCAKRCMGLNGAAFDLHHLVDDVGGVQAKKIGYVEVCE